MERSKVKKIKRIGDFYVTKLLPKENAIHGIYFDKKYEKLIKIKDRQAYVWFVIFAILEGFLRTYIYEIVVGLGVAIMVANLLFHLLFIRKGEIVKLQLPDAEFYEVVCKKHRAWRQNFTMTLTFVCLSRLLIFVQPNVFTDFEVTTVYCISLALSFYTIIVWIYFGGIKNQIKQIKPKAKKSKKKMSKKKISA